MRLSVKIRLMDVSDQYRWKENCEVTWLFRNIIKSNRNARSSVKRIDFMQFAYQVRNIEHLMLFHVNKCERTEIEECFFFLTAVHSWWNSLYTGYPSTFSSGYFLYRFIFNVRFVSHFFLSTSKTTQIKYSFCVHFLALFKAHCSRPNDANVNSGSAWIQALNAIKYIRRNHEWNITRAIFKSLVRVRQKKNYAKYSVIWNPCDHKMCWCLRLSGRVIYSTKCLLCQRWFLLIFLFLPYT